MQLNIYKPFIEGLFVELIIVICYSCREFWFLALVSCTMGFNAEGAICGALNTVTLMISFSQ